MGRSTEEGFKDVTRPDYGLMYWLYKKRKGRQLCRPAWETASPAELLPPTALAGASTVSCCIECSRPLCWYVVETPKDRAVWACSCHVAFHPLEADSLDKKEKQQRASARLLQAWRWTQVKKVNPTQSSINIISEVLFYIVNYITVFKIIVVIYSNIYYILCQLQTKLVLRKFPFFSIKNWV